MAARFRKPSSGKQVPIAPQYNPQWEYLPAQVEGSVSPKPPKMDKADSVSAALWNILSGLGGVLKEDVRMLKANPVGTLKATADAYTIGPEARQRFKQGDYAGAVIQSGLGGMAALPEMQKLTQGKAGLGDLGWLAATYLGGPLGKSLKEGKAALGMGSKKAYLDILSRLPK